MKASEPEEKEGLTRGRDTDGVKTLLGDPKRAIIKLAIPMTVAMSVQTIYNLVDAIWVSGLGADALAAVGFFFPFFFMSLAIGNGIGMGAGAAISRNIGAKDKRAADSVASHAIVLLLICTVAFAVPFFIFSEHVFVAIGAGDTTALAVSYARVIFAGTILIFFPNVANAILRAEGDAKRAMYAMLLGSILNIVLDPVFIYILGLGVAGAAWATVVSMAVTSTIMFNWLFVRKDTYVDFVFHGFRFERPILKDIFRVGLPASFQSVSMSVMMFIMNVVIVWVGGTDGVAVFTTGWRIVMIALLPLFGIATAVVSVTGAAFGAGDHAKLDTAYMYAIKIGLIAELPVLGCAYAFAPQISGVFTWSEDAAHIADDIIAFLRIVCLFFPFLSLGVFSGSMFQGTGKGAYALTVALIRTVILMPPLAYVFAIVLDFGLTGIWWSIVTANVLGPCISLVWARIYISGLKKSVVTSRKALLR